MGIVGGRGAECEAGEMRAGERTPQEALDCGHCGCNSRSGDVWEVGEEGESYICQEPGNPSPRVTGGHSCRNIRPHAVSAVPCICLSFPFISLYIPSSGYITHSLPLLLRFCVLFWWRLLVVCLLDVAVEESTSQFYYSLRRQKDYNERAQPRQKKNSP